MCDVLYQLLYDPLHTTETPQWMGNIRPQMIFVPKPELRVKRRGMDGWVFPGHYSKYAPIY